MVEQNPYYKTLQQSIDEPSTKHVPQIISEDQLNTMLEEIGPALGKAVLDEHKRTGEMLSIINAMQLKKSAGENFTVFLLYIIKLFSEAIKNNTICLKKSIKKSTITELNDHLLVLKCMRDKFCSSEENETSLDDHIAVVVRCAHRVKDVVKGLQKTHFLRFSQSAKTISALIPMFEQIAEVVNDIKEVDCGSFAELLGSVENLKSTLAQLKATLERVAKNAKNVGLIISATFLFGGVAVVLLGAILLATPAAPAGIPLVIAGGVSGGIGLAGVLTVTNCFQQFTIALPHVFDERVKEGNRQGKSLVTKIIYPH